MAEGLADQCQVVGVELHGLEGRQWFIVQNVEVAEDAAGLGVTPSPYQDLIVPGFVSGVGWAIGQISWFIANDNLGLVVSFPIICLGPSIVGCLWSVFLFKEIRGVRNYVLLLASFIILAIAATCTVFAKNGF